MTGRLCVSFIFEGRLISFIGAVSGIVLGVLLCWLQQTFGLISLGAAGSFIVDAYPVSVHWEDVVLIFFTVLAVGFSVCMVSGALPESSVAVEVVSLSKNGALIGAIGIQILF